MYDFNKKRNQKVVAIVIIVVIAAMLVTTFVSVSYTHLTLPTKLEV